MPVPDPWVMDTSVFTHCHRAGNGEILRRVAPDGQVILIPDAVNAEVELARESYSGIPAIADCEWAKLVVLGSDEGAVQLAIQADMGADTAVEHAGEAAVIAYAQAQAARRSSTSVRRSAKPRNTRSTVRTRCGSPSRRFTFLTTSIAPALSR